MRPESIEKHFGILERRYGEKKLREAAERRAHLDYQRIRMGDAPGSGKVKFLLAQMHQNYYFGYFETACILSGVLLEQGLICCLEKILERRGPLQFRHGGSRRWLQNRGDLLDLDLVEMLELARAEGILRDGKTLLLSHEIRWVRNMVVHDRMPVFVRKDEKRLEMRLIKSRKPPLRHAVVLMDRAETEGLSGDSGEITAYFCISRIRRILRNLFASVIETEERTEHESSGSLFQWQEPGQGAPVGGRIGEGS
jgi:hypothetical protein